MVERVRTGYVEQKYPRLSLSVLLAVTSIFFSLTQAEAQEPFVDGTESAPTLTFNSLFELSSEESAEQQPLSELLPLAYQQLKLEFQTQHPDASVDVSISEYYHQQAGQDSSVLLNDHTYQKLVTLETFAALAGEVLPDPYYHTPRFRQREQLLRTTLAQLQTPDEQSDLAQATNLSELIKKSARLAQLSEFGIYMQDYAAIQQKDTLLLLHTTQETQVASIGISFMARHFWSAVKRQQLEGQTALSEDQWLLAMIDSFAYFEGLKAMNPYSATQTDESFAYHLESEVEHFSQFSTYTLESIDTAFAFEFEKLISTNADAFPVGTAGQAVPYTFYTYPASDDHAQGFDPLNLPPNVLFGQKFEDGSAFIIYSSGESRAGLTIYDKLALFQNQYLPSFSDWWRTLPQKAELALDFLPAARFDEANRLASALMQIPFARLVNYAHGDLATETAELYTDLMSDPALGFDEFAGAKQKLALLLLLHRANPTITHPVLQRDSSRFEFDIRSELFNPLTYQNEANTKYEEQATDDETPLVFLPLNTMRTMSTFQTLLDFGIVPTTYQHTGFELTPELLAQAAEYLVTWHDDGTVELFQIAVETETITSITIDVDGNIQVQSELPLPDLRQSHLYAIPKG